MRDLSAIFAKYPDVKNSGVELDVSDGGLTLGELRRHRSARARERRRPARARHGAGARRHERARCGHLPRAGCRAPALRSRNAPRRHRSWRRTWSLCAKAPKGEDYSGPVLFEGASRRADFRRSAGPQSDAHPAPGGRGGRGGGAPDQRVGRTHGLARPARYLRRGGRPHAEGMARPSALRQL